jgi:hypothetical protein
LILSFVTFNLHSFGDFLRKSSASLLHYVVFVLKVLECRILVAKLIGDSTGDIIRESCLGSIADPKGPKVADGAGVQDKSAIGMVMEDLDKADQKEVD